MSIQIRFPWYCWQTSVRERSCPQTQILLWVWSTDRRRGQWYNLSWGQAKTRLVADEVGHSRLTGQAVRWTKRLRVGSAPPDRTPCLSRMSAMEQLIRKYAEEPKKSVMPCTTQGKPETENSISHKHIDVYTKDLIKKLRENNVNLGRPKQGNGVGNQESLPRGRAQVVQMTRVEESQANTRAAVHEKKSDFQAEFHKVVNHMLTEDEFGEFGCLLIEATAYNVNEIEKVRNPSVPKREKWWRIEYQVNISVDQENFTCECGQFEHTGILCCHILRVMEILHLKEIPAKHIVKRWTKDARSILTQHLVQYQKDNSVNLSFTCRHSTLYLKAMEVVRLGDASAEAFDRIFAGLEALMVSGGTFAERRDGLVFEDRMADLVPGTLPGNGELHMLVAKLTINASALETLSVSTNTLHGLTAPEKQRVSGDRPTAGRRHRTKGSVRGQDSAAFVVVKDTNGPHALGEGVLQKNAKAWEVQAAAWRDIAGPHAVGGWALLKNGI